MNGAMMFMGFLVIKVKDMAILEDIDSKEVVENAVEDVVEGDLGTLVVDFSNAIVDVISGVVVAK